MSSERAATGRILVDVFRDHRDGLHAFVSRKLPADAAEDLLQECFVRTWEHRQSLEESTEDEVREAARKYLWRVARNLVVDEIRLKVRRGEKVELDGPGTPALRAEGTHAERIEMEDAARVVRETVGTLPNRQTRRCLELWLDGRDLAAIAKDVSLRLHQVRGLLQRGRSEVIRRTAEKLRPRPLRAVPPGGEES